MRLLSAHNLSRYTWFAPVIVSAQMARILGTALIVTVSHTLLGSVTVYRTVYRTILIACLNRTVQERTIPSQNEKITSISFSSTTLQSTSPCHRNALMLS